ncbi:MAG: hypothetical protein JNM93_01990 [Bacteriovoracaceae bacterium]|nr:hypothetical protein [Bacteriovoracaceae bacterium]
MNNETQERLLKSYRQQRKNYTLIQMSQETGIQQTRLFRIFNGSEMKISEYAAIEKILYPEQKRNQSMIDKLINEASQVLMPESLNEICQLIHKKLSIHQLLS